MATNYNYPSAEDIETQAKYRPGVASNIFNVLTGGLAGQITGSTQRAQEAARARQALLQEEFGKRDEQRTLERQLMVNALQQGIAAPEGATLEEKMADFRNKALRRTLATVQGTAEGLKSPTGPYQSPYQSDPAFQISAAQAQADLQKRLVEYEQTETLQRRDLFNQAKGLGVSVSPEATSGEIRGAIEAKRPSMQAGAYTEEAGRRATGQLQFLQQSGEIPSVIDINTLSPEEKIAYAAHYSKQYDEKNKEYAFKQKAKAESNAVSNFNQLLSNPQTDKTALREAYLNLPKDSQIEEYRIAAGVARPANTKENESLDKYIAAVDRSSALVGSIQSLVGNRSIPNVSQESFNGFTSWMRGAKNKLGAEDPSLRSINNVVQEFQALIAQQRKDFFGASLTDNEFEVAKQLFADPNQANFLPRVLELVDSIMSKDEIQNKYTRRGIFVDSETKKDIGDKRREYYKIKSELNFGGPKNSSASRNSEAKKLKGELDALKAYITNAPSVSITNTPTSAQ